MIGKFTLSIANYAVLGSNDYWFTIKYLAVVVIFIYLLWIFSKYITKKNYISLKDRNIKVLERIALSNDKYIILVELENIFYLLGIDKNGMTVIDKRTDLSLDAFFSDNKELTNFSDHLKTSLLKRKDKSDEQK